MPNQRPPSRVALPHLRAWRAWRGLSMEQLAERAGLTRGTIYNLESGNASANPVTLFKLARALDVPRHQLIDQDPPEGTTEEGAKEGQAVA